MGRVLAEKDGHIEGRALTHSVDHNFTWEAYRETAALLEPDWEIAYHACGVSPDGEEIYELQIT